MWPYGCFSAGPKLRRTWSLFVAWQHLHRSHHLRVCVCVCSFSILQVKEVLWNFKLFNAFMQHACINVGEYIDALAFIYMSWLRQGVDVIKGGMVHDMLDPLGMLYSLKQALRCKVRGLGLFAVPCNSFNWMSSSQHCRHFTHPWGNCEHVWVRDGNVLASRSCLIILVLIARSCFWMTENPDRSHLSNMPPLMHVMTIAEMLPLRIPWWWPQILLASWTHTPLFEPPLTSHMHHASQSLFDSLPLLHSIDCGLGWSNFAWGTWDTLVAGHWSRKFPLVMCQGPSHCPFFEDLYPSKWNGEAHQAQLELCFFLPGLGYHSCGTRWTRVSGGKSNSVQ